MKEKRQIKKKEKFKQKVKEVRMTDPDPYYDDSENIEEILDEVDEQLIDLFDNIDDEVEELENETKITVDNYSFSEDLDVEFKLLLDSHPRGPTSKYTPLILVKMNGVIKVLKNNTIDFKSNKGLLFVNNCQRFLETYLNGFYGFEEIEKSDLIGIAPSSVLGGGSLKDVNRNYILYGFLRLWNGEYISLNLLTPVGGRMKNEELAFMKFRLALGNELYGESVKQEFAKLVRKYTKDNFLRERNDVVDFISKVNNLSLEFPGVRNFSPRDFIGHLKKSERFNRLFSAVKENI